MRWGSIGQWVWRYQTHCYLDDNPLTNWWRLNVQVEWTIEARANFADPGRKEAIDRLMKQFALRIKANLALLADQGVRSQVSLSGMHGFDGPFDIGLDEADQAAAARHEIAIHEDQADENPFSAELLADMTADTKADAARKEYHTDKEKE